MKKMMIFAAAAAALIFTGCKSINTSDGASAMPLLKSDAPGYQANFQHKNTTVEGSAQINVLFGFIAWGAEGYADNTNLTSTSLTLIPAAGPLAPLANLMDCIPNADKIAKQAATYNTCIKNKADALVGTRYVVTTTDYIVFKKIKCEVKGYPAVIKGITKKVPYLANGKLYWLAEKPVIVK